MDEVLLQRIREATPEFNPSLANGLAVEHMEHAMGHIDLLFDCIKDLFPEGLTYDGSSVCSPIRHFEELTREYNTRRQANIARYDTYMVKYQFSYQGEQLRPRFVQLPFVRPGGIMALNGATYHISPVLSDVGYSVGRNSIFVPFNRTKQMFMRLDYRFFANDNLDPVYVVYSKLHKSMGKAKTGRHLNNRPYIESCLPHYLFAKYGLKKTFRQYGRTDVQVGWQHEFPEKDFPRKDFVICTTANRQLRAYRDRGFSPVEESDQLRHRHPVGNLCLVIPKKDYTRFNRLLVAGFFYVMDTFPDRFRDLEVIDTPPLWQVLLGHLIYGDNIHGGKLQENVTNHMDSMDTILDEITRQDLRRRNIHVDHIYDLLVVVMSDLLDHFYQTSDDEVSMYGKRMMVLRYVLNDFNNAISNFGFALQNNRDKVFTGQQLDDLLKKHFKPNTAIRELSSKHGEINTISYPGDNKIFQCTGLLIPQDKAVRGKHNENMISDNSHLLDVSIAEVGSYMNLPKNAPDGRNQSGMFTVLGTDGMVMRNPKFRILMDKTQHRIKRRTPPA